MNGTRVAITIVTYNSARYIAGCLDGSLAQDHAPLEIVVIDDGVGAHAHGGDGGGAGQGEQHPGELELGLGPGLLDGRGRPGAQPRRDFRPGWCTPARAAADGWRVAGSAV